MNKTADERVRKRPVYLAEIDWDLVVACMLEHLPAEPAIPSGARTLWKAGAERVRLIVDEIHKGKRG